MADGVSEPASGASLDSPVLYGGAGHGDQKRSGRPTPPRAEATGLWSSYTNLEKEYAVRYWAIGNEPSLYEAEGLPWDATSFSLAWQAYYAAMKAVDPDIVIMGPETHQFTGTSDVDPVDSQGNDWLRTFLEINGDLVDMVSVHRYPFPNNARRTPASIADLHADAAKWDGIAHRLRTTVQEVTGRNLPIAITEVNSHWSRLSPARQHRTHFSTHFGGVTCWGG